MKREYHHWHSPRLNREMELLVFGHAGSPVLVFPARMGRFYDYENWGLVGALRDSIDQGLLQLFCVDSLDAETLYCRSCDAGARIHRYNQYERYLLGEVLPFIRSVNPNEFRIAHGCSIGGYHAVNIALRHPGMFRKVVALSGRYDLTRPVGCYEGLFGGHYSEDVYFHTPNHFLPNLTDEWILEQIRRMEIHLAVGDADYFYSSNAELSDALARKGVSHRLAIWDGKMHNPEAWRRMVPVYL